MQTRRLDLAGGIAIDLHLPDIDPGALLFCLAGGGANRRYFDLGGPGDRDFSFAHRMTAQGFAVAAADIPGVGDSPPPPDADFTPRDAASQLAVAVAELRRDHLPGLPALGIGHSMGGMLIVLQQAHDPAFSGLALLGSNAGGLDWALTDAERACAGDEAAIARDLAALTAARFGASFVPMQVQPGSGGIFAGEDAAATARLREARDRLFNAGGMMSMIPGSFASEAAAITCPMLFIAGDKDIGIPVHRAPADFPGSSEIELLVLPGTGHNHFGFSTMPSLCNRVSGWAGAILKQGNTP